MIIMMLMRGGQLAVLATQSISTSLNMGLVCNRARQLERNACNEHWSTTFNNS
jgi:hypothetical protein